MKTILSLLIGLLAATSALAQPMQRSEFVAAPEKATAKAEPPKCGKPDCTCGCRSGKPCDCAVQLASCGSCDRASVVFVQARVVYIGLINVGCCRPRQPAQPQQPVPQQPDPATVALLQQIAAQQAQLLALLAARQQQAPAPQPQLQLPVQPQIIVIPPGGSQPPVQIPIGGTPPIAIPQGGTPQIQIPQGGTPQVPIPQGGQPPIAIPQGGQPMPPLMPPVGGTPSPLIVPITPPSGGAPPIAIPQGGVPSSIGGGLYRYSRNRK